MSGTIRRERAHQQRLHPRKRRRVVLDRTASSRSRHLLFLSPPFLCLTLTCCTLRPGSLSTCLFSQQGARIANASDLAETEPLPGVLQARFLLAQTPNIQDAHLGWTTRPRLHGRPEDLHIAAKPRRAGIEQQECVLVRPREQVVKRRGVGETQRAKKTGGRRVLPLLLRKCLSSRWRAKALGKDVRGRRERDVVLWWKVDGGRLENPSER